MSRRVQPGPWITPTRFRNFLITSQGIDLVDIYTGSGEALTGSAQEKAMQRRDQERKRKTIESKIAVLRAEFDAESEELDFLREEEKKRQEVVAQEQVKMKKTPQGETGG